MSAKPQSHTDAVLNVPGGSAVTGVAAYVGLFSAALGDASSSGTELASNGHQRQAITVPPQLEMERARLR